MRNIVLYSFAALAEIASCFAFWAWLRHGASAFLLVPGMLSLACFAWLLTLVEIEAAGRTFAAYGGIYICASMLWLWRYEGITPTRWDVAGVACCLAGAAIIVAGSRG